jgi:C_GCAxxG_C_C family probable redox protein
MVFKATTGFGGGIGARGSMCGIISGSVIVIGIKHGRGKADKREVAVDAYMRCSKLLDWFNEEFESTMCADLTGGVDFRDPKQLEAFKKSGHEKCIEMAGRASAKLAELLE